MVTDQPTWIWTDCEHCGTEFGQPYDPGRRRRFCSGRCRTAAYRARKRRQEQEQQRQERWRGAYKNGYRRSYEEAGHYQRQRARSQPPPHAGTSRPGAWCGACGGVRGPHTFHHDDQAHQRARRRYDGLKAKAASTSYPHEADACHAKADAMRDKYGL